MIINRFFQFIFIQKANCPITKFDLANLSILLGLNLLCLIVLDVLESLITYPKFQHAFSDNAMEIFETVGLFLFFVAIIVPVIEELTFRYFLVGNNFSKLIVSIILMSLIILFSFDKFSFGDFIYLICLIYLIVIFILSSFSNAINIPIMAVSSMILFGIYHLSNFEYEEIRNNLLYIPLLIFPQVLLGLFLNFIRINFGLIPAVIYHSLYNTLLLCVVYLLYLFTGKIY